VEAPTAKESQTSLEEEQSGQDLNNPRSKQHKTIVIMTM
jgi:hypothetical protein